MTTNNFSLESVEVSLSARERFEEFLQSKGKRITRQRRELVDFIFSRHEHFDAEGLMAELAQEKKAAQASRPTVYRTLAELVQAGLLRKMNLAGRAVYEHDYGYPAHDHLYCKQCERLFEFHSEELERIRDAVAQEHKFRVEGHRFIVTGVCQACSQARRRSTSRLDRL